MSIEIRVPDIGNFSDVDVIDILVKVGDTVAIDDALITLESDKASMDIPASRGGVVQEIKIAVGDKVSEGSLILLLADAGEASVHVASAPAQPKVSGGAAASVPVTVATPTGLEEICVPDIGNFKDVDVIEVLVRRRCDRSGNLVDYARIRQSRNGNPLPKSGCGETIENCRRR